MTPAEIARSLSAAQRRIVLNFPQPTTLFGDTAFVDYQRAGIRQRRTRTKLTNSGITECYMRGPVTIFSMVRLSPIGLVIRKILEEQEG